MISAMNVDVLKTLAKAGLLDETAFNWAVSDEDTLHLEPCDISENSTPTPLNQVDEDVFLCWSCRKKASTNNLTPAHLVHADNIGKLQYNIDWLEHNTPDTKPAFGDEVSYCLQTWMLNLSYLGRHSELDELHYQQLDTILDHYNKQMHWYESGKKAEVLASLSVEQCEEYSWLYFAKQISAHEVHDMLKQTAWVSAATNSVTPGKILAFSQLPELRDLNHGDKLVLKTTLAEAIHCRVRSNNILFVGEPIDDAAEKTLLKLIAQNPQWDLAQRTQTAQALTASYL